MNEWREPSGGMLFGSDHLPENIHHCISRIHLDFAVLEDRGCWKFSSIVDSSISDTKDIMNIITAG